MSNFMKPALVVWGSSCNEQHYKASIDSMRLRLQKLQEADSKVQKLRQQKTNGYEKINNILHYQSLLFVPKAIWTELISRYYNNPLTGHFAIEKSYKLLGQKYNWPNLRHNVEVYVKDCHVCLASKVVRFKPYSNLQLLPIQMY